MNKENAIGASTGFQRTFLIFSNEDGGYEAGQKPSGHIRLEVREGRGRLHAAVQNLQPGNGRFAYGLYLLHTDGGEVRAAYAGQLKPVLNKAELEWSFDPQNVGTTGIAIQNFDTAAVLVEKAQADHMVICPLVAYRGKKTEWRNGFRSALAQINSKAPKMTENPQAINFDEGQGKDGKPNKNEGMEMLHNWAQQTDVLPIQQDYILKDYMPMEQTIQEYPLSGQNIQAYPEYGQNAQEYSAYGQNMQDNLLHQKVSQGQLPQEQNMRYDWQQGKMPQEQVKQEQMNQEQTLQQQDMQYQGMTGQLDTGCVYLNGNICGAYVNTGIGTANPCAACNLHHGHLHYTEPPAGDVSLLKEELDRYFEQCDPFHSKRSDYLWWRVSNPVNLNNMLYQCNIRSPLLFNPAVMMAHYKYKHLIVGIFTHRAKERQYIVCGVPGMSMVDKKPFGDMSKWVQAEGNRPRYGAFGYWLVYIDPNGGKILNMGQE